MAPWDKVRIALVALNFILISVSSLGVFVYTWFEVKDNVFEGSTYDCESDGFKDNHPLQIVITIAEVEEVFECAWPWTNTILRASVSLLSFLVPYVFIYFGIYKKKTWFMWLTVVLSWTVALILIAAASYDTNAIFSSLSWCKDFTKDFSTMSCNYAPFFGMACVEFLLIFLWITEGVLLLIYNIKYMKSDFNGTKNFDYTDTYYEGTFSNPKY